VWKDYAALPAPVKKPNLIYMKVEPVWQRWSPTSCSLSVIGSLALKNMQEKKSIEERRVVVLPRLYLVGKRYDLWDALQEHQT
jgi:hypothetical protein